MPRFTQIVHVFRNPQFITESVVWESEGDVSQKGRFLGARTMPETSRGAQDHCTCTTNRVHLYAGTPGSPPRTSSWKSMERSDGCQEKIVPRSETRPEKGQAPSAATGCADAAAVPQPLATLTPR